MVLETFPVGPLQCNCSIVADETTREAIVIDPGDEITYILQRLAAQQLTLKQIVVTHAHIDHVGGASKLKRATGAPVFLNQNDLSLLDMLDQQANWIGIDSVEKVAVDASADDLATIGLSSIPALILHTPGHTPGSICLLLPAEQLLFSGDTLFAGTIGRTDLPGGDSRTIIQSLRERLLPLPDAIRVIPGHGPSTTIGAERETNPFLKPNVRF